MSALSGVIIPVQCEYLALEGLGQLTNTIERIQGALYPGIGSARGRLDHV